jgi:hypothetical protein
MPLMPNPYVKNVAFVDGNIVLAIRVDEYPVNEVLEISGYATQAGGAFAVFNDIQPVRERNPDGTDLMYVKASPSPAYDFKQGHDVTVVLRAARVWTTVLGESPPEQGWSPEPTAEVQPDEAASAEDGTSWSEVKKVAYAIPLPTGNAGQASAGGETSFQSSS